MNRLEGKTALITGAASGIGMETAKLFASEGAKVLVVDVNDSEGEQTATAIRDSGGEALYQHADVSSSVETEAMIRKAEVFGKVNLPRKVLEKMFTGTTSVFLK